MSNMGLKLLKLNLNLFSFRIGFQRKSKRRKLTSYHTSLTSNTHNGLGSINTNRCTSHPTSLRWKEINIAVIRMGARWKHAGDFNQLGRLLLISWYLIEVVGLRQTTRVCPPMLGLLRLSKHFPFSTDQIVDERERNMCWDPAWPLQSNLRDSSYMPPVRQHVLCLGWRENTSDFPLTNLCSQAYPVDPETGDSGWSGFFTVL